MRFRYISLFLIPFLLAGCLSIRVNSPEKVSPTSTVEPVVPSNTPVPSAVVTLAPLDTPTPDLTDAAPALMSEITGPPRSLYFLVKSALWVLRPGEAQPEQLTPGDSLVTAFDVWPEDGRITYGTLSGKLYAILPGKDPRLLVKHTDEGNPVFISGAAWSPDGESVAYTVDYDSKGEMITAVYPSRTTGVWTVSLSAVRPTFLVSNHYLDPETRDVNQIRRFSNPRWSPDGKALLLSASYWEWSNQEWLFPLEYHEDGGNLHNLGTQTSPMWTNAAWTTDSQGVLLSGQGSSLYGDLAWASRDGSQSEILISGAAGKAYIYDAYMVPENSFLPGSTAGIESGPGRLIYLASCPDCQNTPRGVLWTMRSKWVDPNQNAGRIGPDALCSKNDSYGYPNEPRRIAWSADFSRGILICGWNEIYQVEMRRDGPVLTDLLPSLPALGLEEVPLFRWGEVAR